MINGVELNKKVITRIPTKEGTFNVHLYHSSKDPSKDHMALVYGHLPSKDVLVRVHSECFTGEVLGSVRCDCKEQLVTAQHLVAKEGSGVIIYLRQEGRGIGLLEKLKAYNLQDQGLDTVDANLALGHQSDARTYEEAALMLKDLGIESVRLLTNNPEKVKNLTNLGIQVTKRVAMMPKELSFDNMSYLATKIERMSHMLPIESFSTSTTPQTPPSSSSEEDNDESENIIKKSQILKLKTSKTNLTSVN